MEATEALSTCFEYRIDVTSARDDLRPEDLLGTPFGVHLRDAADDEPRHFHGLLTDLAYRGTTDGVSTYRLVLRPWLWLLTQTTDCRIFQHMKVTEIISAVFDELGDVDLSGLTGDYPAREYVVQYRETDFDFISRLLEREGIYYYFAHKESTHTLVLVDSCEEHQPPPGTDQSYGLPFEPPDLHRDALLEYVESWDVEQRITPGSFAHGDFDWTKSRARLLAKRSRPGEYRHGSLSLFDYPGGFTNLDSGGRIAEVRLEQHQQAAVGVGGASNARRLAVGYVFALTEHPRDDQNRKYLVTRAVHALRGQDPESTSEPSDEPVITTTFHAIPASRQFRPPRVTPKPLATGPQTAIVVGPPGREIWTDQFGRVRVQFHWDRLGQHDDKSSCFIRVSQAWAGTNFGAIHIPRIGQEVIVDFLEGDPERPIITGRVYNDANEPPYELPAHETRSGIVSRSTPDGTLANGNEIRFEDRKGSEELFVQAERDHVTVVKANQALSVGSNRTLSIGADETTSVTANRTTTVGAVEKATFKDARIVTIAKTEDVTVQGKHSGKYHAGREVLVDGADDKVTVDGANCITTVHGEYNITADHQLSIVQKGDSLLMKDKFALTSAGPITVKNGGCSIELREGVVTVQAASEIAFQCGQASISLKSDGTIVVTGAQKVALTGAASSAELSGSGASVSGPKVSVTGSTLTEISGGIVKVN